jgi:hypothetical protein
MLADRFVEAVDKLEADAAAVEEARAARDAFIEANFPALDQAFVNMVQAVTGTHSRLAVFMTPVIDTFTNRGFTSLTKTVVEIRSTLYGPIERVTFTPALEAVSPNQFGVIRVETEGTATQFGADEDAALFKSLLDRGVVMEGQETASLSVVSGETYEPLTAGVLEDFLARLFIRTV